MNSKYQLNLLGRIEILVNGDPVDAFPSRAAEAIVALVVMSDGPVARSRLVDLIWPDSEPNQAAANLRAILSALRRKLGDLLTITRHHISVDWQQDIWVDARVFDAVVRDPNSEIPAIEAALDLYRGDFLQDLALRSGREFEVWAVVERERLRQLAVDALKRIVSAALSKTNYARGIRYANKWLALDPHSESGHRQMMWLRMRNGERHLALEQFSICETVLAQEFGIEPTSLTRTVYERAATLPEFGQNNFSPLPTPFIGRTDEMTDLRQLFNDPYTRLITLLGPGGIGKTRLALAFGQTINATAPGRFLDGFYFVPLAAAYSIKAAVFAIANAVGLTLTGSRSSVQQLLDYLKERELLLILDNVEQLVTADRDAAEVVEAILRTAPNVRIIVTSRVALKLYDEVVYDVHGLPVPAPDEHDAAVVQGSTAVQLYLNRVQRTQRGFKPNDEALRAIVSTCRLLEGVPLGIELAAAWVRQYKPDEISRVITQSLDTLTSPYSNVPPRQRSLRAAFDYSWQLLSDDEKVFLAALSIFLGEFSEEAAQVVAAQVGGAASVLLADLRHKSLLRKSEAALYSLHEMVRHFAVEHLPPAQLPALEAAYAGFYADLVAGFDRLQHYPTFQKRLALIRPQFANVQRAWEWYIERLAALPVTDTAPEELMTRVEKMRRPLRSYFLATSQFYAGQDCFSNAAERLQAAGWEEGTVTQQTLAAKIAIHEVDFARIMGDYHRAVDVAQSRLSLLEAPEAAYDQASALLLLEESYRHVGRMADVQAVSERLEQTIRETGWQELIAASVMENGHQAFRRGDYNEALSLYEEALALFAPLENPRYEAIIHDYIGQIHAAWGDPEQAVKNQEHALRLARSAHLTYSEAVILLNLAPVYYERGEVATAFETIKAARVLLLKLNQRAYLVTAMVTEGDLAAREGDWALAAILYRDGLRQAAATGVNTYIAQALARIPQLLLRQGKTSRARWLAQRLLAEPALSQSDRKWVDEVINRVGSDSAENDIDHHKTLLEISTLILDTVFSPFGAEFGIPPI